MKTHITQNADPCFPYLGVILSDDTTKVVTLGVFTSHEHASDWCEHVADLCEERGLDALVDAPDEAAPELYAITQEFPDDWVKRTLH